MGALFSAPKIPTPPPPPPAANPPVFASSLASGAGGAQSAKARAAAGMGFSETLRNEGKAKGLTAGPGQLATKSLLG